MVFLDMGDDPIPHHHRIRLEGCAPVVAEDVPVTDPADEPLRTGTFSEPHNEGSISTGLPWDGGIKTDKTGIPDEIEIIHELPDDLGGKESGTIAIHRIRIVHRNEHGSVILWRTINSVPMENHIF